MDDNTVLVGDFANGAQLFDRQQMQILVSDNVNDAFIRNVTVILGEWRGALAVYAPFAFAKVTIT
jgi:HK97 family phage major capsid protein